jgi:hypothetical protein
MMVTATAMAMASEWINRCQNGCQVRVQKFIYFSPYFSGIDTITSSRAQPNGHERDRG